MSDYLQKIIYLTQAQYNTLKSNGTVEGQTGINDNYLYFITDEGMSASDLSDDFILPVTKGGTGKKQITSGSLLVGNGTAAMTEIAATNVNTANTIVKRDGNGNFSMGALTATKATINGTILEEKKLEPLNQINSDGGNMILGYKKSGTGVSTSQWCVGTVDIQGVIRSSNTDLLHSRNGTNSVILDDENYNSYAPTLTGNGASGTWNINISGSAGSVAWTNVSGRPTNLDQFTNGPGYVTSSGVTKVSTGAGLTGGDITTAGTISINGMNTSSGATNKWLNQKGEWTTPPNDDTHHTAYLYAGANNATKHAAVSSGTNIYLCLRENGSQRSAVQIKQGSNMTISSDANGIITFAAKDTTYSNFVKSGAGAAAGLVPSPGTTAGSTKYLCEDGTWSVPPDTKYTLPAATSGALGGIKIGFSTNATNRNYAVQLSSEKAYVNVPWTDTNNKVTQAYSTTNKKYPLLMSVTDGITSTDARGDTTAILNNALYANPSIGTLYSTKFCVDESVTLQYNDTDKSLEFIF